MRKCKYCGAWIDWITTQTGRHMPVEPRPVVIRTDRGAENFITRDGKTVRGERTPAGPIGGNRVAYVPHWAWCRKEQPRQASVARMRAMRERSWA